MKKDTTKKDTAEGKLLNVCNDVIQVTTTKQQYDTLYYRCVCLGEFSNGTQVKAKGV